MITFQHSVVESSLKLRFSCKFRISRKTGVLRSKEGFSRPTVRRQRGCTHCKYTQRQQEPINDCIISYFWCRIHIRNDLGMREKSDSVVVFSVFSLFASDRLHFFLSLSNNPDSWRVLWVNFLSLSSKIIQGNQEPGLYKSWRLKRGFVSALKWKVSTVQRRLT